MEKEKTTLEQHLKEVTIELGALEELKRQHTLERRQIVYEGGLLIVNEFFPEYKNIVNTEADSIIIDHETHEEEIKHIINNIPNFKKEYSLIITATLMRDNTQTELSSLRNSSGMCLNGYMSPSGSEGRVAEQKIKELGIEDYFKLPDEAKNIRQKALELRGNESETYNERYQKVLKDYEKGDLSTENTHNLCAEILYAAVKDYYSKNEEAILPEVMMNGAIYGDIMMREGAIYDVIRIHYFDHLALEDVTFKALKSVRNKESVESLENRLNAIKEKMADPSEIIALKKKQRLETYCSEKKEAVEYAKNQRKEI